jgi:hypothetical protein
MVQMIKLGETDPKLSLAALTLALELEEMELFVEIRKLVPANTIAGVYVGYLQALDCNLRARKCRENEVVGFFVLILRLFNFRRLFARKSTNCLLHYRLQSP